MAERFRYYVDRQPIGYRIVSIDIPVEARAPYLGSALTEFTGAVRDYVEEESVFGYPVKAHWCGFREYGKYLWRALCGWVGVVDEGGFHEKFPEYR